MTGTGKPDQVIELLSSAPGINNDSRLLTARAEAKLQGGDYTGAIDDFSAANKITQVFGRIWTCKDLCPER